MSAPLLLLGALCGYALLLWSNPIRASLLDGLRAVRRYPALALAFGVSGFAYALFQLGLRIYLSFALPEGGQPLFLWARSAWRPGWSWWAGWRDSLWYVPGGSLAEAARGALLPMLDSTAGLFNNLVTTFPLAAVAALLLLVNYGGYQRVLWRALRRRSPRWALAMHAAILLCALAAVAKPLLYVLPRYVDGRAWLLWGPVVSWLGFLFEYLSGVGLQLCLLLLAWCWVRGLSFRPARLLAFAIRRFSFVLRWAGVVMLLSTLLLDLPLLLQNVPAFARWQAADAAELDRRTTLARVVIDLTLLAWCSVQIILTLHNESLARSLRDHLRFARRHAWPLAWLLLVAGLHFYALHAANLLCLRALGEGTALWIVWTLVFPWLAGAAGAWLLASWVSMFRRLDAGRLLDAEWVGF